jgi:hypothetical protein
MPPETSPTVPAEAVARVHGAARISDSVYWTGHVLGLVLLAVAVALIVFGRGPRRAQALAEEANEK